MARFAHGSKASISFTDFWVVCCRVEFKTGRAPTLPFDIDEDEEAAESESGSHDGDAEDSVHDQF